MSDNKMIRMVGGHEIYLEAVYVKDAKAEIILGYGHNMVLDGRPDADRVNVTMFGPDKKQSKLTLNDKDDHYTINFDCTKSGYYTIFVDLSPMVFSNTMKEGFKEGPKNMYKDVVYAGAWHQMAKTVIPGGKASAYTPEHMHGILDLIPKAAFLSKGADIELTVLYEGQPLPDAEVKAVSKQTGKEMALGMTDVHGIVRIPITSDGEWMFLCRHRDPSKAVEDKYDEAVFVTTLVMKTT